MPRMGRRKLTAVRGGNPSRWRASKPDVRMSVVGYKQTLAGLKITSALHPGADLPGGPPLKVKLTSVAESCLASIARGTPGRVRSLRSDSWAGSGLRAPFCLWNQSVGPLAHRPHPGGVPNARPPMPAPRSHGRTRRRRAGAGPPDYRAPASLMRAGRRYLAAISG